MQKIRACRCPQCKSGEGFYCFWKVEKEVPEDFKPLKIKAFISVENINGLGFLRANEMGADFDLKFLSWFLTFCVGKNINAFWKIKEEAFCVGSPQFVEIAWRAAKEGSL